MKQNSPTSYFLLIFPTYSTLFLIHHSAVSFSRFLAGCTGKWQFEPGLRATSQLYNGWPLNLGARWFYVFSDFPSRAAIHTDTTFRAPIYGHTHSHTRTQCQSCWHRETGVLYCSFAPWAHHIPFRCSPSIPCIRYPLCNLSLCPTHLALLPPSLTLLTWLRARATLSGWRS